MLSFGFRIFCWYRGFCHRTGSDLLFLSTSRTYAKISTEFVRVRVAYTTITYDDAASPTDNPL